MAKTVLSRYLDPDVLGYVAGRPLEPESLVIGNLAGAHKSPLAGFAVEFSGHREYVPGDDPRHVDWRVYFNRDKYFVKQYELETNFVCHLLLDVSASMRYGAASQQKMQYASQMAAVLGYSIVRQTDKVSLTTFDLELRDHVPPGNTMDQVVRLTERLDAIEPRDKTEVSQSINAMAARIGRREIVMIFSDFFGADVAQLEQALQRLRYGRHEVVLFHTLHGDELRFDFQGMMRFEGLEEEERLLAQTEDVRAAYLEAMDRFRKALSEVALRNGCEYVLCDTTRDQRELFVDYLSQRGVRQRFVRT